MRLRFLKDLRALPTLAECAQALRPCVHALRPALRSTADLARLMLSQAVKGGGHRGGPRA